MILNMRKLKTMASKQGEAVCYSHIRELSTRIKEQAVSPVDVVRECLGRIERLSPRLNAFITIASEQAMEQARVAAAEVKGGKGERGVRLLD
jgi:Asp-tRNA(Asn)/Glu-tRNA(Gln) amidotransferase A subunit family amidase